MVIRSRKKYYFYYSKLFLFLTLKSFFLTKDALIVHFLLFSLKHELLLFKKFNNIFLFVLIQNFFNHFIKMLLFRVLSSTIYENILSIVEFLRYRYFLKIGLSFKKKYFKKLGFFTIFIGHRHWVLFKLPLNNFYFNIRRKNIVMFMRTKNLLNYFICLTRYLRKETVFKTKGIMFSRV